LIISSKLAWVISIALCAMTIRNKLVKKRPAYTAYGAAR
jgi:hypothetical protein